ncbi:uncharacterized protein LOC134466889 [Engraulis encrasicolus]|uniref:uncharacterized protein LOC134466889 n=1 Tax=Engraulis encrasicolus TaxID=184585 RepID=UPI002FD57748
MFCLPASLQFQNGRPRTAGEDEQLELREKRCGVGHLSPSYIMSLDELMDKAKQLTEELDPEGDTTKQPAKRKKSGDSSVVWRKRDLRGQLVSQRPGQGTSHKPIQKRRAAQTTGAIHEEPGPSDVPNLDELLASLQEDPSSQSDKDTLTWAERQAQSEDRWGNLRPSLVNMVVEAASMEYGLCQRCTTKEAVVKCRQCQRAVCGQCDRIVHEGLLHDREAIFGPYCHPLSPDMVVDNILGCHSIVKEVCLLPVLVKPRCPCARAEVIRHPSKKEVILIGMNGRYQLQMPTYSCSLCDQSWEVTVDDLIMSSYWPGSVACQTIFDVDLFRSYRSLKLLAPGLSRQAFLGMLDDRTKTYGRAGKISGDTFQKSFVEWCVAQETVREDLGISSFTCTACTPVMHAIAVDGNRKLYRFSKSTGPTKALFMGKFLAMDEDVADFVEEVQSTGRYTPGKAYCGSAQFTAARERASKNPKQDEEGVEVAVCRHGVLLRGLNMFRGEVYAYPMFLQKDLASSNPTFFCSDVMCRYWPYLESVSNSLPALKPLLDMKPLLSVMHARAHDGPCELKWSGRNQLGAGNTIGEEVEQVNSFLSRAGLSTKYMGKSARVDSLSILAIEWNKRKFHQMESMLARRYAKNMKRLDSEESTLQEMKKAHSLTPALQEQWVSEVQQACQVPKRSNDAQKKIEALYVCIKNRKHYLYRTEDSNKRRHAVRRKIREETEELSKALDDVRHLFILPSTEDLLQQDNFWWPWSPLGVPHLQAKRAVHDQVMLVCRLTEESSILKDEMTRHVQSIKDMHKTVSDSLSVTEHGGKAALLQKRLEFLNKKLLKTKELFTNVLKGELPEEEEEEEEVDEEQVEEYEDSEEEDEDVLFTCGPQTDV